MRYLVKVREIFEHTYLVEAESKEAAEEITIDNSDGCDLDNDYTGAEYEVGELGDEDPDQYDECCVKKANCNLHVGDKVCVTTLPALDIYGKPYDEKGAGGTVLAIKENSTIIKLFDGPIIKAEGTEFDEY